MGWELGFLSALADGQNLTQKGWSEGYFPYQRKLQKTKTLLAILIRKRYNWGIAYTKLMGYPTVKKVNFLKQIRVGVRLQFGTENNFKWKFKLKKFSFGLEKGK